ncbi:phytanoyl-CoA dioxygenase [Acaromyces ingoldii]|uniref:Phytanoyl-CoA dioxygenase n=1 Tax=Acaromyces ingoldii TaxID=215250 RepID=A0A316YQH0_9BASI|nr:phytanoyl-CoA dioxygenase [Acaromyces ingoldii]PWN90918.1 phytanoyl-CoA dioxygenase [Acaromyces ingoldii]
MISTATETSTGLAPGALTPSQLEQFRKDGYLILHGFFDPAPILARARDVIQSFDPAAHPLTKFVTGSDDDSTKENEEHVGNAYFLESGDSIRFFLEEGAVDPKTGQLNRQPDLAVNKAGHALHVLDRTFYDLSFSDKVQNLVRSLESFTEPRTLQSMIICKQPSIGGAVPPHNDSTFLYTDPPSATGLWFALEDCTKTNGCLSFLPGSHRWPLDSHQQGNEQRPKEDRDVKENYGVPRGVNKRFVRKEPTNTSAGTTFEELSVSEEDAWRDNEARVEECKAGTLVLIHGSVLHKSEKNLSDRSRYIYTFHAIEGDESKAKYDEKNWLQPTKATPFSKLYNPPPAPAPAA